MSQRKKWHVTFEGANTGRNVVITTYTVTAETAEEAEIKGWKKRRNDIDSGKDPYLIHRTMVNVQRNYDV